MLSVTCGAALCALTFAAAPAPVEAAKPVPEVRLTDRDDSCTMSVARTPRGDRVRLSSPGGATLEATRLRVIDATTAPGQKPWTYDITTEDGSIKLVGERGVVTASSITLRPNSRLTATKMRPGQPARGPSSN